MSLRWEHVCSFRKFMPTRIHYSYFCSFLFSLHFASKKVSSGKKKQKPTEHSSMQNCRKFSLSWTEVTATDTHGNRSRIMNFNIFFFPFTSAIELAVELWIFVQTSWPALHKSILILTRVMRHFNRNVACTAKHNLHYYRQASGAHRDARIRSGWDQQKSHINLMQWISRNAIHLLLQVHCNYIGCHRNELKIAERIRHRLGRRIHFECA